MHFLITETNLLITSRKFLVNREKHLVNGKFRLVKADPHANSGVQLRIRKGVLSGGLRSEPKPVIEVDAVHFLITEVNLLITSRKFLVNREKRLVNGKFHLVKTDLRANSGSQLRIRKGFLSGGLRPEPKPVKEVEEAHFLITKANLLITGNNFLVNRKKRLVNGKFHLVKAAPHANSESQLRLRPGLKEGTLKILLSAMPRRRKMRLLFQNTCI